MGNKPLANVIQTKPINKRNLSSFFESSASSSDIISSDADQFNRDILNATVPKVSLVDRELCTLPLDEISAEIRDWKQIIDLDLSENDFLDIPLELTKCKYIKTLIMNENQIEEIGEYVKHMPLKKLHLAANNIQKLQCQLPFTLVSLDLSENKLETFPNIFNLKLLCDLSLQSNSIKEIPSEIKECTNLMSLEMNNNELTVFPIEICRLYKLKKLNFSNNHIMEIPAEISNLTKLKSLLIRDNEIKTLPISMKSLPLKDLDVSQNRISHLPCEIGCIKTLQYLKLDSDKQVLMTPPSFVVSRGEESILSFLQEGLESGIVEYSRIPLLILGQAKSGKTFLRNSLLGSEKLQTGVGKDDLVLNGESGPTYFTLYDFGEKKIYDCLHPYFMSQTCLFLVTFDMTSSIDDVNRIIKTISIMSPDSKIIVVGTKSDLATIQDFPKEIISDQIVDFVTMSTKGDQLIDKLKAKVYQVAQTLLDVRYYLPKRYLNILELIEKEKEEFCVLEQFKKIIQVENDLEFERIVSILHYWGVILHFDSKGDNLADLIVLKPLWLSNLIISILGREEMLRNGILEYSDLEAFLSKTTSCSDEKQLKYIKSLLHSCEFMYQITPKTSFIPAMVNEEAPNISQEDPTLNLNERIYVFEFLPVDFYNKLLVRVHKSFQNIYPWSKGFLVENGDETCLVHKKESCLILRANGVYPLNLISTLAGIIDNLLTEFKYIKFTILISCPKCSRDAQNGIFELEKLRSLIQNTQSTITCKVCSTIFPLEELYEVGTRQIAIQNILRRSEDVLSSVQIEFLHRQYIMIYQTKYQGPFMTYVPVPIDSGFRLYQVCQHLCHWHLGPNHFFEILFKDLEDLSDKNFDLQQDALRLLRKILQKVPLQQVDEISVTEENFIMFDQILTKMDKPMDTNRHQKQPFIDLIIQKFSQDKPILNLMKTPTFNHPLYICDQHKDVYMESMDNHELTEASVTLESIIGKGAYATVFSGFLLKRIKVAVKQMKDLGENAKQEIEILRACSHENIVLYYGSYFTHDLLYVVMEYVENKTLREVIRKAKSIQDNPTKKIFKMKFLTGILDGMRYLHGKNIIHGDLKPENIMISFNDVPKIGDFGLSMILSETKKDVFFGGTPQYMAPELISDGKITSKIDVYSFGVLLWELFAEEEAFSDFKRNPKVLWAKVKEGHRPVQLESQKPIPLEIFKLINVCWSNNPMDRPSFEEIYQEYHSLWDFNS